MTDTYSVAPGRSNDPRYPPIELPVIEVNPQPPPEAPVKVTVGAQPRKAEPVDNADPWALFPKPKGAEQAATTAGPDATAQGDPWALFPTPQENKASQEKQQEETPKFGKGEAALKGAVHGITFGFAPALEGLSEAAGPQDEAFTKAGYADPTRPFVGAYKMLTNYFSEHPDPTITEAYNRGRERALKEEQAAQSQHQIAYFAGQLAGSMAVPIGGTAMQAGTAAARALRGGLAGGVGGGLFGAGEATSEGKSAPEVTGAAVRGAAIGAPLGGALTAALGRRAFTGTPGQRAARTAEDLGAPLPRGVVSDSGQVQAVTSNMMALPVVGPRIRGGVQRTGRAAGERVEEIAGGMAPRATERAAADVAVRPGIQNAINANVAAQNAAYNGLRRVIDPTREMQMPNLTATLNRLEHDRIAAGWAHPGQGFEQFRRLAGRGAHFNGAHRARVDARNAGNVISPNPGYNSADFNQITRAITADLRQMVQDTAHNQTAAGRRQALRAFEQAEQRFGPLAEMNDLLNRLLRAPGEGGIATLLNAAKERGGDLRLLQQLRRTMPPADFNVIGGMLLSELGGTGEFSLARFATNFNKLSDGAVNSLFAPGHAQHLRDIAAMGEHVRHALETASTSHSSNWLAFLDISKDIALLSMEFGQTGGLGGTSSVAAGVSTGALYAMGWILGNPARTASYSAFTRAYQALTMNPTPARIAVFNAATRNLANTLGIPVERLTNSVARRLARAEPQDGEEQNAGQQQR